MKPWDGIISEEEQKATYAAGFGRPSSIGKRPALLIIDVQYRTIGTTPKPFSGAIKEFPTSLRRGRLERDAQHRAAARRVPPQRAGRCSIRTSRRRTRPPTAAASRRRCRRSWTSRRRATSSRAEIAPREGDVLHSEEASERVLRHAAREPPDRPRRRHAGGHRLHDQRLRARQRASTRSRTTSASSCRTTRSTTAARPRTR